MTVSLPNESREYRAARANLLAAETDLRAKAEEVAALRRTLPRGGDVPEDYLFHDPAGQPALMSSLFGDQDTLAIYSLMYGPKATAPCPMCSAFLDGLSGQVKHLARKTALAVVAQNSPQKLAELSNRMGWSALPLYSAQGTSYQRDYLAENESGDQLPILNIFQRDEGGIRHFWSSELFFEPSPWHPRHIDPVWSLWNLLDLTPQGRGDFMPRVG
ncbi:DUF899 family protein [Ruegeria sediminis]|nr:DUF899 family protein [Ruegeria sediminis]